MTSTQIVRDTLEVSFAGWEKVLGVVRDLEVPLADVESAVVVADGFVSTRGLRSPGMSIPGRRKLGTWRARGVKQLVSVRAGQPAVRVGVHGQRYSELLLGMDTLAAADSLADRLGTRR